MNKYCNMTSTYDVPDDFSGTKYETKKAAMEAAGMTAPWGNPSDDDCKTAQICLIRPWGNVSKREEYFNSFGELVRGERTEVPRPIAKGQFWAIWDRQKETWR